MLGDNGMIVFLPMLVCIVGLLIYALAVNGKVVSIGKDMFWVGLLVTLLRMGEMVKVLP